MACIYTEHDTLPVAELRVLGRVTEHDMDVLVPKMEAFIKRHGEIRILEVIEKFEGFDLTTVFDGAKFDIKHFKDVSHAAVVSDIPWVSFMTNAFAWVSPVAVRTFAMDDLDAARTWIENPD